MEAALPKDSKLQEKHPALLNMKFLKVFLLLWVIFALLDPHSHCGSKSMRIRIHNTDVKNLFYEFPAPFQASAGVSAL
jgi:hypothetical protein